jgi:hypothetical protein
MRAAAPGSSHDPHDPGHDTGKSQASGQERDQAASMRKQPSKFAKIRPRQRSRTHPADLHSIVRHTFEPAAHTESALVRSGYE